MRFQGSNRSPYLNRRDQTRLAIMVCMIAALVFAIDVAARPSSWYWLTGVPDGQASEAENGSKSSSADDRGIDFRPDVDDSSLGPDAVRVVGGKTPEDADRYRPQKRAQPAGSSDEAGTGSESRSGASGTSRKDGGEGGNDAAARGHNLVLSPELTDQIQNNSVGLRESERELYYYLLAKTRDVPTETLKEASQTVAFPVLMSESEDFLGELITVKGEIRRLTPLPPGRNDFGIDQLWEAWLFNADSGKNPYCIRMTSLPEGIPTGMSLGSGTVVEVTGYFFKRYGYPAQQERLHVAPLVLAKTMRWFRPRSVAEADDLGLVPYVLVFAGGLGSAIAILLWRFRRSDRRFEKQHLERLTAAPEGAIEAISDIPTIEVEEALRQMSARDASHAASVIDSADAEEPNADSNAEESNAEESEAAEPDAEDSSS